MSKKFNLVIFILLLFLIAPSRVYAAGQVVFQDDFNDGDNNGWTIDHLGFQGSWKVDNNEYLGAVTKSGPDNPSITSTGQSTWQNFELELDVRNEVGIDKFIMFKYTSTGQTYAVDLKSGFSGGGNILELTKNNLGTNQSLVIAPFVNQTGVWYHIKISVLNNNIKIFVNNLTSPLIDYQDNVNPVVQGKIALMAWPGSYAGPGSITKVRYDNIVVRDLDILPVPFFFQDDPTWGNDAYGNVAGLTMASHGCYVTSAAMILDYLGIDSIENTVQPGIVSLTPQTLNNWLKLQPDGYIDGNTNYAAILRWARIRHDLGEREATMSATPLLTYEGRNVAATSQSDVVDSDLSSEQPDILRVSYDLASGKSITHFLVARGKKNGIYQINDPLNIDTDLDNAIYDNELTGYRRYMPQTTSAVSLRSLQTLASSQSVDLSSLVIAIAEEDDLLLISNNGEKVGYDSTDSQIYTQIFESTYTHELPIVDLRDPENSALTTGIKLLTVPHFSTGDYVLKVLHNGMLPATLHVLGYAPDGTATVREASITQETSFIVNYDQNSGHAEIDPIEKPITIDDLIIALQEYQKSLDIAPAGRANGWIDEALMAKDAQQYGLDVSSQGFLFRIKKQIIQATPKFVSYTASNELVEMIDELLQ